MIINSGLPVAQFRSDWEVWTDPSVAFDALLFGEVEVDVSGTGSATITRASGSGETYKSVSALARSDYSTVTTITQPGFYILPGNGFLKMAVTGFTVRRRASA